jgi:hypothetical protein
MLYSFHMHQPTLTYLLTLTLTPLHTLKSIPSGERILQGPIDYNNASLNLELLPERHSHIL